ncbi:hypothetical protein BH23ACT4_BH23ACT4_10210 [soil metagenome]
MGLSESVAEFLESTEPRCELDSAGNPRAWNLGVDTSSAAVIVAPATDALKTKRHGLITGSLDRSQVWEVAGLSLDRALVSGDHPASVSEWVEQLRVSDVELVAIERSDAL